MTKEHLVHARRLASRLTAGVGAAALLVVACVGSDAESSRGSDAGGGSDGSTTPSDASIDVAVDGGKDAEPADGSGDAAPCDPSKDFGTPVRVPGLSTSVTEQDVWLSDDELTAYVTRFEVDAGTGPAYMIATATRPSTAAPFGTPVRSDINNPTDGDGKRATLTSDGLTLYFQSFRLVPGSSPEHVFTATRTTATSAFTKPSLVANINSQDFYDNAPMVTADGSQLYFTSTREGAYAVYRADRGVNGSFGTPLKVDLGGQATSPVLSRDGRALYFATTRAGGKDDIWVVQRSTTDDGFGAPKPVPAVNDPTEADQPNWVSPDGCRLYLSSRRAGGGGGSDVLVATRPR